MLDPDAWHSVRPLHAPSLSIMLSGRPWTRAMPLEPSAPPSELPPADVATLLVAVRDLLMQDSQ